LERLPEGRREALIAAIARFDEAAVAARLRARLAAWIPWSGAWAWREANAEAALMSERAELARTALAKSFSPS
jgi:hypothetical protein